MAVCSFCGHELPPARTGVRGRPRVYHDECSATQAAIRLLEAKVEAQRDAGLTPTGARILDHRRELIALAWRLCPGKPGEHRRGDG